MIEVLKKMVDALENHSAIKHPQQIHYRDAAIEAGKQAIAELESQERNFCQRCGKRTNDIHTCTPPQRTEPVGVMVSMDVSKGDEPEYRIFGRIYEVMKDGEGKDEVTYLAIEDSRNFDTPPQRTWVGLTPSEIEAVLRQWDYEAGKGGGLKKLVAITEAKLKEKNA